MFRCSTHCVRRTPGSSPASATRFRRTSRSAPRNCSCWCKPIRLRFRRKYGVPTNVMVLGPYSGALDNGGEDLQLQSPDAPSGTNPPPYVTIDEVNYNDKSPWPPAADGSGPSLQRSARWLTATIRSIGSPTFKRLAHLIRTRTPTPTAYPMPGCCTTSAILPGRQPTNPARWMIPMATASATCRNISLAPIRTTPAAH